MTNTDKMREDFANHINDCIESEGGLMQALQRNEAGDYVTHWVAEKWVTWQAATLKATEAERERCALIIEGYPNWLGRERTRGNWRPLQNLGHAA
jgi:hypothetical protein